MRNPFHVICALALASLATSCVGGAAGAAAMFGLSLLGEVIGTSQPGAGSRALMIDPNKATSDSLSRVERTIDPRCKGRLESVRAQSPEIEPLSPGECRMTLVCLGGMSQPMMMSVCAPGARVVQSPETDMQVPSARQSAAWEWSMQD